MTTLAWPSNIIGPASVTWRLRSPTQVHRSPLTGAAQTIMLPAQMWTATLSWPTLVEAHWRDLDAFLNRLGGRAGRFFFSPAYSHAYRRAVASVGTGLVNGASQVGGALATDGWTPSATVFRAGDFFSYADPTGRQRLHQIHTTATANGSGVATLNFSPLIRRSPGDNAALEYTAPVGVFMLASDEAAVRVRPGPFGECTLEIMEALI
jgi:hypothetical protein